jgi:hypothetical protein
MSVTSQTNAASSPFRDGVMAFEAGNFAGAATNFLNSTKIQPASGAFVNLGLAEWRRGRIGAAVVAWERALWIEPASAAARNNLHYARQVAEVAEPDLTWYEATSTWLPAGAWAWAAGLSLWSAVALMALPGLLRWRKSGWQQVLAAACFCIFLLCLPAHAGIVTRAKMGFVIEKKVPLRLTPTAEAEQSATLGAGEPVRKIGARGEYYLIRTQQGIGWVERRQVGLISSGS